MPYYDVTVTNPQNGQEVSARAWARNQRDAEKLILPFLVIGLDISTVTGYEAIVELSATQSDNILADPPSSHQTLWDRIVSFLRRAENVNRDGGRR